MHLTQFKFLILSLLGFSMVVGIFSVSSTFASITNPDIEYVVSPNLPTIHLEPNETRQVSVSVKNFSVETWGKELIKLGTVFHTGDQDRPSAWATPAWESATRIAVDSVENIRPLQTAEFTFEVTAPDRDGIFHEYFRPVLEYNRWLNGEPIILTFQVGATNDVLIADAPEKAVIVYRATQETDMLVGGVVVATLSVSSGAPGYTTPAGQYTIMNHYEDAYSAEYKLWMPNWMALANVKTGFRGYGFHGLPYWRVKAANYSEGAIYPGGRLYTQGRLYEGYEHLGKPVSHGCVRFGIEEVKVLYKWAENGTPVTIV